MIARTSAALGSEMAPDLPVALRSRDASSTRRRLLQAARRRFARDGYTGTTVRDIASDAGVNVSLINRYFTSKEGLFEACLRRAVEDLDNTTGTEVSVERLLESMVSQLTDVPNEEHPLHLLLLLRSSGDARADRIRQDTLRYFAESMAGAAGWRPDDPTGESRLLRAQIALSAALGILLLRTSTGLEPLSSATAQELQGPVGEVMSTLLSVSAGVSPPDERGEHASTLVEEHPEMRGASVSAPGSAPTAAESDR